MNKNVIINLIKTALDFHLDVHQDAMLMETYQAVAEEHSELFTQFLENSLTDNEKISKLLNRLVEYIEHLTYNHIFTGKYPQPPYNDLKERINQANMIAEIISSFRVEGWLSKNHISYHTNNIFLERAKELINKAVSLEFQFDFQYEQTINKLKQGYVIEIQIAKTLRLNSFNNLYIRIGQEKNYTILLKINAQTCQIEYFSQTQNQWKAIGYISEFDIFIPNNLDRLTDNSFLNNIHFSVYKSKNTFIIGNVGSKYGIYIQID